MSETRDVFHGGFLVVAGVARFGDCQVLWAACRHDCEHDLFCDLDGVSTGGAVKAVSDRRPTNAHRERPHTPREQQGATRIGSAQPA